jgi:hypothetical protein
MENMEAIRRQAMTTPLVPDMDHAAEWAITTAATVTAPMGTIHMRAARPFSNKSTGADGPAGDAFSIMELFSEPPVMTKKLLDVRHRDGAKIKILRPVALARLAKQAL